MLCMLGPVLLVALKYLHALTVAADGPLCMLAGSIHKILATKLIGELV